MEQYRPHRLVYSPKIADYLMIKGEKLLNVRPNVKDTRYNVFIFQESPTMAENLHQAKQAVKL